jgi:hypothetical protein
MARAAGPTDPPTFVELSPADLCGLLGLPAADAPYLATAPVRLDAGWVAGWKAKTGALELTPTEVSVLLGTTPRAVYYFMRPESAPHLGHRLVGSGKWARRLISPASLVLFLRERNASRGNVPTLGETPGQFERRAAAEIEEALAACRGE